MGARFVCAACTTARRTWAHGGVHPSTHHTPPSLVCALPKRDHTHRAGSRGLGPALLLVRLGRVQPAHVLDAGAVELPRPPLNEPSAGHHGVLHPPCGTGVRVSRAGAGAHGQAPHTSAQARARSHTHAHSRHTADFAHLRPPARKRLKEQAPRPTHTEKRGAASAAQRPRAHATPGGGGGGGLWAHPITRPHEEHTRPGARGLL
jgi:hypothetical protein